MRGLRSTLASLGIALAALGLGVVVLPDAAGLLGLPRLGVALLGLFALVEGGRSLQSRRRAEVTGAELPAPERRHETALPGDDFDDEIADLVRTRGRTWGGREHDRLCRRLEAAAVEAVSHREQLPVDAARERVEAGDWTDDPAAAWFLGGDAAAELPWSVRARAVLGAETAVGFYANRTVEAVVAVREAS